MHDRFVSIGNVCEDVARPKNIMGGGVTYSTIAASYQGEHDARIVTKLPFGSPHITALRRKGVQVINLPTNSDVVTTVGLTYKEGGRRDLVLIEQQEPILRTDLFSLDPSLFSNALVLVAPTVGDEVEMDVIPDVKKKAKMVAVTPQGYFRGVGETGVIFQKEWRGFEEPLSHADMVILSEEDLSQGRVFNENLWNSIKDSARIVALTRGGEGVTISVQGEKDFNIDAFPLDQKEVRNLTGAGDVFGATIALEFSRGNSIHDAAVAATLLSAIKITSTRRGINTIPTHYQRMGFIEKNAERVREFLKRNDMSF